MRTETLINKDQEKLGYIVEPRPMSIRGAFVSVRDHADYFFKPQDPTTEKDVYMRLENVDDAMTKNSSCILKPCLIIDGQVQDLDLPSIVREGDEEEFESVLVVRKCPNGTVLDRQTYHALNRIVFGQGIIERIKLAYLV